MAKFAKIDLTINELELLDDGQEWWNDGDDVSLGGYLPEDEDDNPAFALAVNGEENDSWASWADLPPDIQERLTNEGRGLPRGRAGGRPSLDVERHNITITSDLWQKAERIGDGNASEGIRKALEVYRATD